MKNKKAIILLSGGLDSIVSLAVCKEKYNIVKAIHFNYGQIAAKREIAAFKNICKYYDINGSLIDLKWLAELTENNETISNDSKKYWIPNRNALFINIAACFAESLNCDFIIIGANKTEAEDFKDNSSDFVKSANKLFKYSTQNNVKLAAPLINLDKNEIIKKALELKVPLNLIWSCYHNKEKHCGKCPSCLILKQALKNNNKTDLQKLLF